MYSILEKEDLKNNENISKSPCPVNSYNEWDPLEEVIVGIVDGATFPKQHVALKASIPKKIYDILFFIGGMKMPSFLHKEAKKELKEFVNILESEGVKVKRPEIINFGKKYKTLNWESKGNCVACPRDSLMVVGDKIIEAPMSWRCRYYETESFKSLLLDYFKQGAKWVSAPKPRLLDSLYDQNYTIPKDEEDVRYVINESEIVFDAADFVRCGRDLFVAKSNVTNDLGIEWLQRELGDEYRIHKIESKSRQPMHIDTTFMPLAPGKVLVNPKYIDVKKLPDILKSWDILIAPEPDEVKRTFFSEKATMCSLWLNMNVLMLDQERVIVERSQTGMIKAFKNWGFKPIPCDFMNFAPYGGAFHCATIDIRRRGELKSYF